MGYWTKIDKKDLIKVEVKLQASGYTNSIWSAYEDETVAIATFIDEKERHYILLNEVMAGTDPYRSWVNNREYIEDIKEFIKLASKAKI